MRHLCLSAALIGALLIPAFAQKPVDLTPVTTVAKQTQNNTSASGTYSDPSVGTTLGNVSKIPFRQLLPGFNGKIYASVVLFWGNRNHLNVGYNAADPRQVDKQIEDMISRGMNGAILDWYGGDSYEERATEVWRQEVAKYPGFEFAIQEDANSHALRRCQDSPCAQQTLINDLNFIASHYFTSSHYMRINGRPVVPMFDVDWYYPDHTALIWAPNAIFIDWNTVRTNAVGNPLIVQRGPNALTENGVMSDGAFSWLGMNRQDPYDEDLGYLTNFYNTALSRPDRVAIGSVYKGFNDTKAPWTQHRILDQHCGKLWLDTFSTLRQTMGDQINQLDGLQVVTWNDYEEATVLEPGVGNCLTARAEVNATQLNWSISPDTPDSNATLSMFMIFISMDGTNLALLEPSLPVASRTLDLTQYALPAGTYKLFVKARGQPSIHNHLSDAVSFRVWSNLTVRSPHSDQVISNPVLFDASATSTHGVSSIVLNIDGNAVYSTHTSRLQKSLNLHRGQHRYLYTVWDNRGHYTKEGGNITVQ